jgi:tetratricopeptide (TPR) repeat protein
MVESNGAPYMDGVNRFVGVAIDEYEAADLQLDYAVAEVHAVARLLTPNFAGQPICNATEDEVRRHLKALADERATALVLVWSGHGRAEGGQLLLRTRESAGELEATEVIRHCVRSGAAQLLFLIDSCHAGQAVVDAARVASELLAEYPPDKERVWFGIVVSCRAAEQARDGAFGALLQRLLSEGPRSADMRRRWSRHNRWISGDDLGAALLEDWEDEDQHLDFVSRGRRWMMIPNPLWDPGAPDQVVEHLLLAGRGGDGDEQSWFSGRIAEVNTVVDWVRQRTPGVRVVTGSDGTGKSAIAGRVVSVSNPSERARLLAQGGWQHADPGQSSVHAHIHARGLTTIRAAELLDEQLSRSISADVDPEGSTLLPSAQDGWRNADELVGALQRAHQAGAQPPVIVIDGLDEARGEAFTIAADLVTRLAAFSTVIVSTRTLIRDEAPHSLLEVLTPTAVLDLDAPAQQDSQREAIGDYVTRRLAGRSTAMDSTAIANELSQRVSAGRESFLLARIVVDQLVNAPIDTTLPNWEQYLARSIAIAFDVDLARASSTGFTSLDGVDTPNLARTLLVALTWGVGAGLPEEDWLAIGSALTGFSLHAGHISWVLDQLGRYVVQDGEGGVAVYRIAHQSLADHLRPPYEPSAHQPFDPAAMEVWLALADRYRQLLEDGHPAYEAAYLWRYARRHAAAAGPDSIDTLRALATDYTALQDHLAQAQQNISETLSNWGNHRDALAPAEEAVALYRALATNNRAYQPSLAMALGYLCVRYRLLGRALDALAPAEEAAASYRKLAIAHPGHQPSFAGALSNLAICYRELGRLSDALAAANEAATIYRVLAPTSSVHRAGLAAVLTEIGVSYRELGQLNEALAAADEAAAVCRILAAAMPDYQPRLAAALGNLGLCYREMGRAADALASTAQTADIYRDLAATNPTYQSGFASALGNLGLCYGQMGQLDDAVPPAEESVALYRELAAANLANQPGFAAALINLGGMYRRLGRRDDALHITEEAAATYRDLAAANPAHRPRLAEALNNLCVCNRELGRITDALAAAEEAVNLFRERADTSAYKTEYAHALTNFSLCHAAIGQFNDAVHPCADAAAIYRELAATDPAQKVHLYARLTSLIWLFLDELHRPGDALEPAMELVTIARELVNTDPAYQVDLARALTRLGDAYNQVGRPHDALEPAEGAITIFRTLAEADASHRPGLAAALGYLGLYHHNAGRPEDALTPFEEAVTLFGELNDGNSTQHSAVRAQTMVNFCAVYSALGRFGDAVVAAEEAITIYRELAEINPIYEFGLAATLTNLGVCRHEVGHITDALAPVQEAVTRFRTLAAAKPAHLGDLASSLTNLEFVLAGAGGPAEADTYWAESLAGLDHPQHKALLLLYRANGAAPGDVRAATWLADAIEASSGDRELLANVHDVARQHRDRNPQVWDSAWTDATNQPLPAWLLVNNELLAAARGWTQASNYEAERDYLTGHPELLESSANIAIVEALLPVDDEEAARYRAIRAASQTAGVDGTYQPLLTAAVVDRFVAASPDEQEQILQNHHDLLTGDVARAQLDAKAANISSTDEAERAYALVVLSAHDDTGDALNNVFLSLAEPALMPQTLRSIARGPHADNLLKPASAVARISAETPESAGLALLYAAVAAAITGDTDAAQLAQRAAVTAPRQRNAWIALLADIGVAAPAALSLIPYLLEGS